VKVAPRNVLERLLERNLPPTGKDATLIRVTVEGEKDGASKTVEYQVVDLFDEESNLTSMMRTTAFPATAVATMSASGTISERGVLPPELAVPPLVFIEEMRKRGITIQERVF